MDDEDERTIELDCIAAIFPEIVLDPENPFSASIELPVHPQNAVKVVFPASSDGALPTPPQSDSSSQVDAESTPEIVTIIESHNLSYLPSLKLHITLPEGYPEEKPPKFEISTSPSWLSQNHLDELQANGERVWEEAGRSAAVYGYIDFLQQSAENAFGFAEGKVLEIPQDLKISLLDWDIKATQAAFEKENFACGICLDPKRGSVCHQMIDCGHVFCVQCLQDFYNNAINEGDLAMVRCLAPDCAKKRLEAQVSTGKSRKPKTNLSPSELLQIPLEHDVVTRYVKLKHKADLESDKNTIYCPRKWCQGAAKSKKHRKPVGLEIDNSDDESDADDMVEKKDYVSGQDLLSVCEDCSYAFCSRCYQGWHGELTVCSPKRDRGELTEEDKASLEYLQLHTTPCPTCAAPAQKTHGCNHMICFKCRSHFCYLCSAWLMPANPYQHYNTEQEPCYMRLWELEGGDGDDVGIGYAGGAPRGPGEVADIEPEPEPEGFLEVVEMANDEPHFIQAQRPIDDAPLEALQREGPLVLRINHLPPQPAPAVPDPPQQARRGPNARPGRGGQARRVVQPRHAPVPAPALDRAQQEAAQREWVQRFVQMALNDEEDELESDDEDDDAAAWEIPVR
ncbi:E3 ubiquitin-protein ligase [Lachnellula subtilissima]|uniref:RBR-type E3 ubiquitin transferase n=1 Tax=Lachnellula subtilissima TaxID=602034 RepID=A0A8H8UF52_9HELO|nr:E3 ubiquitin-protein ligase [Lachnellula subtilissima]